MSYEPSHREQQFRDWFLEPILAQLVRIEHALTLSLRLEEKIMLTVQDVKNSVQNETNADTAIITLLNLIASKLAAIQTAGNLADPQVQADLQSVIDLATSNAAAVAKAVTDNTPAAS